MASTEEILKNMDREGFTKTGSKKIDISAKQRVLLIRKGNELFNSGDVLKAKKIFIAMGYCDGLIRLGDYYESKGEFFEAFRMYKMAPAESKTAVMIEQMAYIVRHWLSEDKTI